MILYDPLQGASTSLISVRTSVCNSGISLQINQCYCYNWTSLVNGCIVLGDM